MPKVCPRLLYVARRWLSLRVSTWCDNRSGLLQNLLKFRFGAYSVGHRGAATCHPRWFIRRWYNERGWAYIISFGIYSMLLCSEAGDTFDVRYEQNAGFGEIAPLCFIYVIDCAFACGESEYAVNGVSAHDNEAFVKKYCCYVHCCRKIKIASCRGDFCSLNLFNHFDAH